jgi:hypothetical protein
MMGIDPIVIWGLRKIGLILPDRGVGLKAERCAG